MLLTGIVVRCHISATTMIGFYGTSLACRCSVEEDDKEEEDEEDDDDSNGGDEDGGGVWLQEFWRRQWCWLHYRWRQHTGLEIAWTDKKTSVVLEFLLVSPHGFVACIAAQRAF